MPKIERFVKFISFVYGKWWFNCSNATAVPVYDFQFLKDLEVHKNFSQKVLCNSKGN